MVEPKQLITPGAFLLLTFGCNAIFDIEAGTPLESEGEGGAGGSGSDDAGRGGNAGKGGATGGKGGGAGAGASGGTDSSGGAGGSGGSEMAGNGGSSGASGSGATSGTGASGGAAGAAAGSAGTAGLGGIQPVECACTAVTPPDSTLIHDFESGNANLLRRAERNGSFFAFPAAFESGAALECNDDPQNCTSLCLRGELDGTGYPFAGLGLTLRQTQGAAVPYDLSGYDAVRFKLKGSIPPNSVLRLDVPTAPTQEPMWGGTCDTSAGDCIDHYKTTVDAPADTDVFEAREVRLTQLGQGNGGWQGSLNWEGTVPAAWDPAQALNLNWQVASTIPAQSGAPFELCIDDIELVPFEPRLEARNYTFEVEDEVAMVSGTGGVAGVTLSRDCEVFLDGMCSLRAVVTGAGEGLCGGAAEPCAAREDETECSATSGCSWDSMSCEGTAVDCASLPGAECSAHAGCFPYETGVFALTDPDVQPGDILGLWLRLDTPTLRWLNLYLSHGPNYDWTVFALGVPTVQDRWAYAEIVVPETVSGPVHQWGLEVALDSGTTGSVNLDHMTIHRP